MAKISVEVDTSERTLSVKVDGKAVPNVREAHLFSELSGLFGVDIGVVEDAGDNLKKVTRLIASHHHEFLFKYGDIETSEYNDLVKAKDKSSHMDNLRKALKLR